MHTQFWLQIYKKNLTYANKNRKIARMSNFSCLSSYFYLGAPRDANISASRGDMRRLPG